MGGSTVVFGAGAFLSGSVCEPIWRILSTELRKRVADGGRVRPEIAEAVETLRLAASAYLATRMSGPGHGSGTPRDIAPLSDHDERERDLSTAHLAGLLRVSDRHARRLAAEHGLVPTSTLPHRWSRADATALIIAHREHRAS
jgi:hypothetical protein